MTGLVDVAWLPDLTVLDVPANDPDLPAPTVHRVTVDGVLACASWIPPAPGCRSPTPDAAASCAPTAGPIRPTRPRRPTVADLIRSHAADIIEPRLTGTFKRRERAESIADGLHHAGLLWEGGDTHLTSDPGPVVALAAATLQACLSWPDAEKIAAELQGAGLLRDGARRG